MGLMDDFETSLQVLRGFETDISVEVNEIKVQRLWTYHFAIIHLALSLFHFS